MRRGLGESSTPGPRNGDDGSNAGHNEHGWHMRGELETHRYNRAGTAAVGSEGSDDKQGNGGWWRVVGQQTMTILWKNRLLKLRKWKSTLVGMVIPTVIFCLLLIIRTQLPVSTEAAVSSPPLAFPSAGIAVFMQSQLCNGLYDLAPDIGADIIAPSLIRELHHNLAREGVSVTSAEHMMVDLLDGAMHVDAAMHNATTIPAVPARCIALFRRLTNTTASQGERTVRDGQEAAACYCSLTSSPAARHAVTHSISGVVEAFITSTNDSTAAIIDTIRNRTGVTLSPDDADTLNAMRRAVVPLLTDPRVEEVLFGGMDVITAAQYLMCPVVSEWSLHRQADPEQNEAATASQTSLVKLEEVFGGSKIFYAPDTNQTRRIVQEMNRTFQALGAAVDTLKCTATLLSEMQSDQQDHQPSSGDHGMLIERWEHIEGNELRKLYADPRYPSRPDQRFLLTSRVFSSPFDVADNFGQRIRGVFTAPASGAYTFWIAGDDHCELFLSTDETRAHVRKIAARYGSNFPWEWHRVATQQSAPIVLEEGRSYYIEAVGKERTGRDHVAVAVQVPSPCAKNVTLCRHTYVPRNGEDAMPLDGVMSLPAPLFNNGTANVTSAPLVPDLRELAFMTVHDPFVPFSSTTEMVKEAMPSRRLSDVLAAIEFHNMDDNMMRTTTTTALPSNNRQRANNDVSSRGSGPRTAAAAVGGDAYGNVPMPEQLHYSIRMNPVKIPATKTGSRHVTSSYGQFTWWLYYYSGFAMVQDMVDRAFTNLHAERDTATELPVFGQRFPVPAYAGDEFTRGLAPVLPLFMTISLVYIVSITVKSIVYEKELRLKEMMRIMGMYTGVHWLAWTITCVLETLPSVFIITMLLCQGDVLRNSNELIVFLLLEAFVLASVMLSFLISCFFSRAKIAAACGGIVYFSFYVPFVAVALNAGDMSVMQKAGVSLMSTTALGIASQYLAYWEEVGVGLQWSNLFVGMSPCDGFSAGAAIVMLLLDGLIYLLLTLYLEQVIPGQFGVPKHPLFFLKPLATGVRRCCRYCCCCLQGRGHHPLSVSAGDVVDIELASARSRSHSFAAPTPTASVATATATSSTAATIPPSSGSAVPSAHPYTPSARATPSSAFLSSVAAVGASSGSDSGVVLATPHLHTTTAAASADGADERGVVINHMSKDYNDDAWWLLCGIDRLLGLQRKPPAVADLSLRMPFGQVTSLLGSNGAGKSTTLSILCGLFPQTSGLVRVHGYDTRVDMDAARKHLGVCLQYNALFDSLTVREHVLFCARIRRGRRGGLDSALDETMHLIKALGLMPYFDTECHHLSGGNKRKLSVALAFVCSPDVVILDEPTAGMDPSARRATWNLILQKRKTCCIILTTHHLDEADLLSDSVAIMKDGELRAHGSPFDLKQQHGLGYTLTLSLTPAAAGSPATLDTLTRMVSSAVPGAAPGYSSQTEATFVLPPEQVSLFPPLFAQLEQGGKQLGVEAFGVSASKLEDVFLEVTGRTFSRHPSASSSSTAPPAGAPSVLRHHRGDGDGDGDGDSVFLASAPQHDHQHQLQSASSRHRSRISSTTSGKTAGARRGIDGRDATLAYSTMLHTPTPSIGGASVGAAEMLAEDDEEIESVAEQLQMLESLDGSTTVSTSSLRRLRRYQRHHDRHDRHHDYRYGAASDGDAVAADDGGGDDDGADVESAQSPLLMSVDGIAGNTSDADTGAAGVRTRSTHASTHAHARVHGDSAASGHGHFQTRGFKRRFSAGMRSGLSSIDGIVAPVGAWCLRTGVVLKVLLRKRAQHTLRDIKAFISMVILPVGLICLAMLVASRVEDTSNFPALELSPNMFSGECFSGQGVTPVYSYANNTQGADLIAAIETCPATTTPGLDCGTERTEFNSLHDDPSFVSPGSSSKESRCDGECHPRNLTSFLLMHSSDGLVSQRHGAATVDLQTNTAHTGAEFGSSQRASSSSASSSSSSATASGPWHGMFARAWFERIDLHSLPAYLNLVNNGVLKSLAGDSNLHIHAFNHPLNTSADTQLLNFIQSGTDASVAAFVIFALSFIPASVLVFLVSERVTRSKFMQLAAGCRPWQYWLACFIWDALAFVVAAVLCVGVFALFAVDGYSGRNLGAVAVLLLLYGLACTTLMYPFSFVFKVPSTAYVTMIVANLFVGVTTTLATFVLDRFSWNPNLWRANVVLKKVFLVFPNYCFGRGLLDIATNEYTAQYNDLQANLYGDELPSFTSPFSWDIAGRNMFVMAVHTVAFFLLTLCIQYWSQQRLKSWTSSARARVLRWWRCVRHFAGARAGGSSGSGGYTAARRSSVTSTSSSNSRSGSGYDSDSNDSDDAAAAGDDGGGGGGGGGGDPGRRFRGMIAPGEQHNHDTNVSINTNSTNFNRRSRSRGQHRRRHRGTNGGATSLVDEPALEAEMEALSEHPEAFAVRVEHLTKVYSTKSRKKTKDTRSAADSPHQRKNGKRQARRHAAVDDVSFGVRRGECFGLLGVNGAGKTTTFKVISGEHAATLGDVFLDDVSVSQHRRITQRQMGYCPQEDALLPLLTPTEHMQLYGGLRGLTPEAVEKGARLLFRVLDLQQWKNTTARHLSGGTKRKLSLAMALLGTRGVVLLDEPSAGLDAHAKRFLWSRVLAVVRSGRSVLLTSHSMEECEALCNRLTIMVDGKLKCIGTPQMLKTKFGDGYTLVLKATGELPISQEHVRAQFAGAQLVEAHRGYVRFFVPTASAQPLSAAFERALALQRQHGLEYFSISQTTLEDIFCKFAGTSLGPFSHHAAQQHHAGHDTDNPTGNVSSVAAGATTSFDRGAGRAEGVVMTSHANAMFPGVSDGDDYDGGRVADGEDAAKGEHDDGDDGDDARDDGNASASLSWDAGAQCGVMTESIHEEWDNEGWQAA
ncbi:ABCA2 protein [Salpingoeca rosetta]|uniref:ABCA2 protein n=1 Tax=Salpingoeca rosetta (strain ATCC 50818 / BSB-021) TaxID=946362 RepID=F2U957_SALR5|nr:ABCA2 protein [Salpingoeca rosetta]EGD73260.1 ABCA2 protein [Salpingoeca rosetta]|eukprot:XP_004994291.1 ABCA2 protein [Salpingoeca rosetta]